MMPRLSAVVSDVASSQDARSAFGTITCSPLSSSTGLPASSSCGTRRGVFGGDDVLDGCLIPGVPGAEDTTGDGSEPDGECDYGGDQEQRALLRRTRVGPDRAFLFEDG